MSREFAVCAYCLAHRFWKDTDLPAVERANQDRYLRAGWTKQAADWVCPACEAAGVAVRACPEKQVWETFRWPALSFADFAGICGLCRENFLFSAAEQQRFYEESGVPLEVVPNNCGGCREIVRRQKAAQVRLEELLVDPAGAEDFESIGEIYAGAQRYKKAVEALRRARNLHTDPNEKQRLRARVDELRDKPDSPEPWPLSSYSSNPHFYNEQRLQRADAVRDKRVELGDRWVLKRPDEA
ncbi:MAG: zinc-ribbon domain containing protein [Candidatus Eremiobacteraeota bacterium]|nr:zinc-ribbon domain containing protein [Candidatus Eremiobacteraeota bacterium]MCW5866369.1 zinc-ribbon domain containing protein [Candidatus Eremiobacteraeota bacterium]